MTAGLLAGAATVLDLSSGIAGPYCTKLLADAGADVIKVEAPEGDPLRRWSASGADLGDRDGALFRYLNAGKRSVVADSIIDPAVAELLFGASVLVHDGALDASTISRLRAAHPALVVTSITPFGLESPWAGRPGTEFTLQALCGSIAGRGRPDGRPLHAGGRLGEWISGVYAAVPTAAAQFRSHRTGVGDHVDVSMLECMSITMGGYGALMQQLGAPRPAGPARSTELPSIEPTEDGFVGFCTITGQQFADFLVMIERGDLLEDRELATYVGRQRRRAEFVGLVHEWTTQHTTAEIVELATLLRIPVAAIGTPSSIPEMEQFTARGVYVPSADGDFVQPRSPSRVDGVGVDRFGPAPGLGEHTATVHWPLLAPPSPARTTEPAAGSRLIGPDPAASSGRGATADPGGLPLAGIRVIDLTAFWAGPAATLALGALGADVIKVESVQRPDGMRFSSARPPGSESWWEWSGMFQAVNANKRDVTLNLRTAEGRGLLDELIAGADVLIENFSPRVFDEFGLDASHLAALNPRLVTVRMPAFGLDGPWRDRTGFAQTMEQASGMAWMTGERDGPPLIPRGACDPLAGMHAALATIVALDERDRSGRGHHVETTMVEAALNVAAEIVIEHSAYGATLTRDGNRGPVGAPQNVYPCRGAEQWLAVAVASDDQWRFLREALGDPAWASNAAYATAAGRRAAHDEIDAHLGVWAAERDVTEAAATLSAAGVPAEVVVDAATAAGLPPLADREFVERVCHPVLGDYSVLGLPFRLASHPGPWFRMPSPTLGQHNDEVLGDLLGHGPDERTAWRASAVIGETL